MTTAKRLWNVFEKSGKRANANRRKMQQENVFGIYCCRYQRLEEIMRMGDEELCQENGPFRKGE